MTVTKEQIDAYVSYARENGIGEAMGVIVALADQRAELVALLEAPHGNTYSTDWEMRRRTLLARICVTP